MPYGTRGLRQNRKVSPGMPRERRCGFAVTTVLPISPACDMRAHQARFAVRSLDYEHNFWNRNLCHKTTQNWPLPWSSE